MRAPDEILCGKVGLKEFKGYVLRTRAANGLFAAILQSVTYIYAEVTSKTDAELAGSDR